MSEWQPIETAPCDGSRLLLYAYWSVVGSYRHFSGPGWFDDDGNSLIPTHWMPLPDPPK